ncbi:MAG: ATP-dependent helicase, partial [Planctomycetes bacterium]|nr:ATP-dependent helicase [Planctomycetota bacterium]
SFRASKVGLEAYLRKRNPAWNVVGRVHFHLAENRKDAQKPFAFLATYTTRLSAQGKPQHVHLGKALEEYAGAAQREQLLSLLVPVQRAAADCAWLAAMVEEGEIFHALRFTAAQARRFLADVPRLEAAGVVVRMPAGWSRGRPPRPHVTARVGEAAPAGVGVDAILDFAVHVTLEGERLTAEELRALLAETSGLALLRGRWVEVDHERLGETIARLKAIEKHAKERGLSFAEAARLLAGADVAEGDETEEKTRDWAEVVAGDWMSGILRGLRGPDGLAAVDVSRDVVGTLRPYQTVGVRWLHLLSGLGLGACLADDMGLGKTLQLIALLCLRRRERLGKPSASLLVAPASLLSNWTAELEKFAPTLRSLVAHVSVIPGPELLELPPARLEGVDLVITSYGHLRTVPWLATRAWDLVVLDEAQAIKNPGARQTKAAKALKAKARIALTGTPIENRLGDLWSLFDFLNPGLLGSQKQFGSFVKRLGKREHDAYAPLRTLVKPYILRRLKTDTSVISDLPEKTEVHAWCALSRKQLALYQEAVEALATALDELDRNDIRRRGIVLSSLMRLKQICNHPSQWVGDGAWAEADSGKWARLREIAETIASRQEKVLVFTQFREVTDPLASFLGSVFGRPGLVLHGGTPVGKRRELVTRFQEDDASPFFVLSLKAGGSGLNLTAASHVVHFDRWWNPAVENQATDRAFRIGQKKNVLVHKFVCRGTVEEKIDALISAKRGLASDVLEGGADVLLTEMADDELLRLVALDVSRAAAEV